MLNLTVIFAHGKESGPWGTKIRALAKIAEKKGCQIISRDDSGNHNPDLRVSRLINEAETVDGPIVLVGSSMGGYVAAVASKTVSPVGLFLMAPALSLPGYAEQSPIPVARELAVVHGWTDDIVPLGPVVDFSRQHKAMCHLVPAGHSLVEQLEWLTVIFDAFLDRCMKSCENSRERLLATF